MNNEPANVQEAADAWPDPRVERSTRAVQVALAELLPDVAWRELTVQQILDRAGVSRGTFYKHYRNKDDALRASMGGMLSVLQRSPDLGDRLFPVRELMDHVASATALQNSLGSADRLAQLWEEMREELSVRLAEQLVPVPGSFAEAPVLAGRVLAGAMVELIRYVVDARASVATAVLDVRFHRMAVTTIAAFGCVRRGKG
jgi:AcrR family transcriptional regulator